MTKKKRNKKRRVKKSFKDGFITLSKQQVEASRSNENPWLKPGIHEVKITKIVATEEDWKDVRKKSSVLAFFLHMVISHLIALIMPLSL